MTAGAPRTLHEGEHLGPLLQVRITRAQRDALHEAAGPGRTVADVTRQALTLGLRAMGREVVYQ